MKNSLKQQELESKTKVHSREIYRGKHIALRQDVLEFPNEPPHYWDIVLHPGAVTILPVKENGHLLLIQQWRRPINEIIYELCAGSLDEGETPLQSAEREIQEEVGYKAKKFTSLGGFYSAPGYTNEFIHFFIAQDLTPSSLPKDPHEAIDVVEMPLQKALELIDSNEIHDAKTICGILLYKRWLNKK